MIGSALGCAWGKFSAASFGLPHFLSFLFIAGRSEAFKVCIYEGGGGRPAPISRYIRGCCVGKPLLSLENWTLFSWSPESLEGRALAPRVGGCGYNSDSGHLDADC